MFHDRFHGLENHIGDLSRLEGNRTWAAPSRRHASRPTSPGAVLTECEYARTARPVPWSGAARALRGRYL